MMMTSASPSSSSSSTTPAPPHRADNNTTVLWILQIVILAGSYVLAFSSRLFSVLRYESIIHEFDPWFNYRATRLLVDEGFYTFHNWFDERSWYPLGRHVGGTVFPALMYTAAVVYWLLRVVNLTVDIRNVCVLLAPFMAANTTVATYFLTREVHSADAGLIASVMIAVVPAYISRSGAGSFDNEGVAICALVVTFYAWTRSVRTGSMLYAAMAALVYYYMVAAWGGYIFIINVIPLHVLALLVTGRYSHRVYVAYSTFYTLALLLSMQVAFVGFAPVRSAEHLSSLLVFLALQVYTFVRWLRTILPDTAQQCALLKMFTGTSALVVAVVLSVLRACGYITSLTGRFYALLDPMHAKLHMPIIVSVSEHQPTTWASFYFDLHILTFLLPAGLYHCLHHTSDAKIFICICTMTSVYFAGVMVRLMLVLAPVACVMASITASELYHTYFAVALTPDPATGSSKSSRRRSPERALPVGVGWLIVVGMTVMLSLFQLHSSWVTSEAYSSPSIVLSARGRHGGRVIFDDFREAYHWLQHNTGDDARIMSWWDYGYQISGMANRTVLVDNNTWNNTHIATVARVMAANEHQAHTILRALDVDYVLVVFGGLAGYASDDINKFLWMVRIAGGVYPTEVRESDYLTTTNGEFRVDVNAPPALQQSLMYKLCYHRFGQVRAEPRRPRGWDRVRKAEIGDKHVKLHTMEEAFTTEHWLVRIYRVLPPTSSSLMMKERAAAAAAGGGGGGGGGGKGDVAAAAATSSL